MHAFAMTPDPAPNDGTLERLAAALLLTEPATWVAKRSPHSIWLKLGPMTLAIVDGDEAELAAVMDEITPRPPVWLLAIDRGGTRESILRHGPKGPAALWSPGSPPQKIKGGQWPQLKPALKKLDAVTDPGVRNAAI